MLTLKLRLTIPQVRSLMREVPAVLAGKQPDPYGDAAVLWDALGVEMLSIIREAFLVKARGGTDDAGIKWDPLSEKTIAYGRRHPSKGKGKRPTLTADQDKLWRKTYVRTWHALKGQGTPDGEAKGIAAGHAWKVVKAAGGQTVLQKYGKTPVDIGRDTGRLFNSLGPVRTADQIFDLSKPGSVGVGTNVSYAKHFHAARPLWPEDGSLPDVWRDRLTDTLTDALRLFLLGFLRRYQ